MDDFSWPCANKFEWIRYTDFRVQNVFQVNFQWRWVVVRRLVWAGASQHLSGSTLFLQGVSKSVIMISKMIQIHNFFWEFFAQP